MKVLRLATLSAAVLILGALLLSFHKSQAQIATTISGKFYKLTVVAAPGAINDQGAETVDAPYPPSINDSGHMAFRTDGLEENINFQWLQIAHLTGRLEHATFGGGRRPSSSVYDVHMPLSNSFNHFAVHATSETAGRLNPNLPVTSIDLFNSQQVIELSRANFIDPTRNSFDHIYPTGVGINNNNVPVFSARTGTTDYLVAGFVPNRKVAIPNGGADTLRPMMADNFVAVVRAGAAATDPINLYDFTSTTPAAVTVASSAMGFTALGQSPSISDDGAAVAFYGDLTGTGATALGIREAGPGIFASIDVGGPARKVIRLTGRQIEDIAPAGGNDDGVCDAGETCVPGELGFDASNNPLFFNPAAYGISSRVAIIHQSFGAAGIADDIFVVSFIGTPNAATSAPQIFSNQLGLWTIRVEMKMEAGVIQGKPGKAIPVVQVNDLIGSRTVTGVSVYDQLANAPTDDTGATRTPSRGDHRIAFQASTSSGGIVVRGSHFDSDEDGLFDHWESTGIDFNGNGTIDLPLHQSPYNANPQHKDLFVEIDYLRKLDAGGHTHLPVAAGLQNVAASFAIAPITNPDNNNGITLHPLVDEAITETTGLASIGFEATRVPGPGNDIDDVKLGDIASPCGVGATNGHAGTIADRGSPNCSNIVGARRLSFRYALFAHELAASGTGRAELAGNDFVVTLGDPGRYAGARGLGCPPGESDAACGQREMEAGTFMHELGHTLGLNHGGGDTLNCKPNYLSVMSYPLQTKALATTRPLDYSRQALPSLNEASLDESVGISGPVGRTTVYGIAGAYRTAPANGPIDWNGVNGNVEPSVIANINHIDVFGCTGEGLTVLKGFNDWPNIVLNFRNSKDFNDGSDRTTIPETPELTAEAIIALGQSADYDGDGVVNATDNCLGTFNPTQTDSDGDGVGDACDSFSADLSISIADSPDPVAATAPLTYTITVSNAGPSAATDVSVTDQMPTGVTLDSATASQGSCNPGSTVVCALGTINSGAWATVTIVVTPLTAGTLSNTASVTNTSGDPVPANNSATATTTVNSASPTPQATPAAMLISEFRLRGPNGEADEFVELYNNTAAAITVSTTDGSNGWALAALSADGTTQSTRFVVPNGTLIPVSGHYLGVNYNSDASDTTPRYSLSDYGGTGKAAGDASYTGDIGDSAGIALFKTANPANFTLANRLDAVGFGSVADARFREDAGLLPGTGIVTSAEFSFVRNLTSGLPQDTNVNAADFVLVATTPAVITEATATLGAPGPENLSSPLQRNATIKSALIDPFEASSSPPNRVRITTPVTNGALGTLSIRRKYTNKTGAPVTRLRFRIVDVTTAPAPPNTADLRALTSPTIMVTDSNGMDLMVMGTTLEAPPSQTSGGGLNSTLSAGAVTLGTPIVSLASINVQFVFGVQLDGSFRFVANVEALP
jgi:uncharacterized repeat protein (TIGR01451 family)